MTRILARLAWSAVILLGVSFVTFVLVFLIPADPARAVAGPKADPATVARIRAEMGLDDPIPLQYGRYVWQTIRGDLGRSYVTRQEVGAAILERLPATALLAVTALLFSLLLGVSAGLWTATTQRPTVDLALLVLSLLFLSLPVFWLGLLLLSVFAYSLQLLPLGGASSALSVVLPALALGLGRGAYFARLVHTNLRQVLRSDYIRTARAKGLPPVRVYGKHALRNALLPLTTLIGLDFAGLMSGVVLTETVFNWPGLGRLAVEAVFNQDVPMIVGTVWFGAVLVVLVNIVTDAAYGLIDPRVRER